VPQFDVRALKSGASLVVDCQSDLLAQLTTRFVVPLLPREIAPVPADRLNPIFVIRGHEHVLVTQFAAAISAADLGEPVLSLRDSSFEILGALDMLVSGV
jgi:toxin CcdB